MAGCGGTQRLSGEAVAQWETTVSYGIAIDPQCYQAPTGEAPPAPGRGSGWVLTYTDAYGIERVEQLPEAPLAVERRADSLVILMRSDGALVLDLFRNGYRRTEAIRGRNPYSS